MNAYVAKYTKPIPLEELPYTPVELGDMLDSGEKEREIEVEGYGKGRLVISKQNKNKPFFYADEKNQAFNAQQMKKAERLFTIANAPAMFAPILAPFTARTQPAKVVLKDPVLTKGKKVTVPLPGSKGGQTLLQQRKTNKQTLAEFEATGFGKTKIAEDVFNMPTSRVQQIVKIAKRNNISYQKAEQYVNLKEQGIIPTETINPGTNAGLIEGDVPLNVLHARLMQQGKNRGAMYDKDGNPIDDSPTLRIEGARRPTSGLQPIIKGDTGMGSLSTRGPKQTYPQYFDQQMNRYGARKDEAGRWILDEDTFRNIKSSNIRRELAQMLLTDINQGVKGSFISEKLKKNTKLNKDLARYNKTYAARADLHHGSPSVIGIEFFLGIPYMGEVWKQQIAIAAKYGNFPGQPMVEGRSNLVSLPSSMPSTHMGQPNLAYEEAREALEKLNRKVPKHIHRIIHDQFLANEMGQKGEKFWAKWDPIIQKAGNKEQAWIDAYEDFNLIIARNRQLYMEALKQLEVIFSNNPLSNDPDKLADMLEQYVSDGKVIIGKGVVRGKDGKPIIVKPGTDIALSGKKTAVYSQDAVQYEIEDTLLDFKRAIRTERIKNDPRYRDVVEEIEYFPKLTFEEMTRMEELLYNIKTYNQVYVETEFNFKKTFGETKITKAQHKANLKEYYNLWHPKLFKLLDTDNPRPKINSIRKLQTTTHRDAKLGRGEETQLIIDFPVQQLDIFDKLF